MEALPRPSDHSDSRLHVGLHNTGIRISEMKIENLRATVRHVVLSSLILALVLMAAGCNGGYGTPSGGLGTFLRRRL